MKLTNHSTLYYLFLCILLLAFDHILSENEFESINFLFFGDWGLSGSNLTELVGTMSQLKNVSFLVALGIFPFLCCQIDFSLFIMIQEITFMKTVFPLPAIQNGRPLIQIFL